MERRRSLLTTLFFILMLYFTLVGGLNLPPAIFFGGLMVILVLVVIIYVGRRGVPGPAGGYGRPGPAGDYGRNPPGRDESRFERLRHLPNLLKILFVVLLVVIILLPVSWTYLLWSINQHVYYIKAGLNWFAIVFYNGYTFAVGAVVALLLVNPKVGHSDIWNLFTSFLGEYGAPRRIGPESINQPVISPQISRRRWFLWQFIKWVLGFVYFISSMGVLPTGNVMNPLMMIFLGMGSWSDIPRLFFLPLLPASGTDLINLMPVMEIQYRLIYTLVLTFLVIFAARTILRMLTRLRTSNTGLDIFNNAANSLLILAAIILFSILVGAPYWLMDIKTPLIYGIVWVLFALSLVSRLYLTAGRAATRRLGSRRLLRGVTIILGVLFLIQLGTVAFYQANMNNMYLDYQWYPQTQKQITVTRWSAGLDNIQTASIVSLPTSNTSTILGLVRQWDGQAATVTMTKEIGAYNWMSLSSTEIVFPKSTEYWVSPTAPSFPATDWISEHLIYTHASRVMVINTHTGVEVAPQQAFNISSEPLIYYGTTNASRGGFYKNVYVHIPGVNEIGNETYTGEPDYTLDGWQKNMWFTFEEGQLGFAFSGYPINMLWNRDILNRVQGILIPGLTTDPAAYLVSDGKNLYYLVQVYIDYPLQSGFAASPYLRFFGVVLVNVYDGSMQGYTVYNVIGASNTDFLSTFYNKYYSSWPKAPDWLAGQIRYPEQLLGNPSVQGQLDYDFMYHVQDPFVWRSGSQFYERPSGNTVQYIPWAVGNQTYFVGMQLIHFVSATSKNLAGVYIAYGGDRLGQIYLFQNPSLNVTFIGPNAAENALQTNQLVRTQLTLLPNYRIGSYLLYSVGGRLDYFVAVYTNPGTEGVVTQLPFMTAIDPLTANVATGPSASAAYYALIGGSQPAPNSNVTQTLLNNISSLISSMNYTSVKATNIYANVFIGNGTLSLNSLGVKQTVAKIADFIETYGPGSIGNTIYEWSDTSGDFNFGVFKLRGGDIMEFYYVTVVL